MHVARWGCYLGGFVKKKKNKRDFFFLPQNSLFRLKSPNVLCKQKGKKTKASALDFLCAAFIWTCLLVWRLIFFPFRRRLDGGFSHLSSRRKVRALNDWLSSIIQKVGNREGKLKMVNNNKIGWGLLGLGEIGPILLDEFFFERSRAEQQQSVLYYTPNKTFGKQHFFGFGGARPAHRLVTQSHARSRLSTKRWGEGRRSHVGSPILKEEILKNDGEKNKSVKRVVVKEEKKMSNRKVLDVSFSTPQC